MPRQSCSHGGQGLGPDVGLFTLWMMTKELAKADMALARCWEGHVNSQMLLNALGRRSAEGSLVPWDRGAGRDLGRLERRAAGADSRADARFGTVVRPASGGYVIDGTKVFATDAERPLGDPAGEHARAGRRPPLERGGRAPAPGLRPDGPERPVRRDPGGIPSECGAR